MNEFSFLEEKIFVSQYLNIYDLDELTNFKICGIIVDITAHLIWWVTKLYGCFFRILGSIKMKFRQILERIMTNISIFSLTQRDQN